MADDVAEVADVAVVAAVDSSCWIEAAGNEPVELVVDVTVIGDALTDSDTETEWLVYMKHWNILGVSSSLTNCWNSMELRRQLALESGSLVSHSLKRIK